MKVSDDEENDEYEDGVARDNKLSNGQVNKHVDFKLSDKVSVSNSYDDEEQTNDLNDETNSVGNASGHCKLRRRDTPHHLKGARINPTNNKAQQLNPDEMKEILERFTTGANQLGSPGSNASTNHASIPGSQHSLRYINKPKVSRNSN